MFAFDFLVVASAVLLFFLDAITMSLILQLFNMFDFLFNDFAILHVK
jgi:hypothetical protein